MMEPKWLSWAKQLQAISQAGLAYSKDIYDIERFELIRNISIEIASEYSSTEMAIVKDLFANESGYATPKVDVRAVVFREGKILMVEEKSDGRWALPGGWADIGLSPSEVAVKEVQEEAGFKVSARKLIAVMDKKCHSHPPSPYHIYKIFILCDIIGGQAAEGVETSDVRFFTEDGLPALSTARNTEAQIKLAFRHYRNQDEPLYFD